MDHPLVIQGLRGVLRAGLALPQRVRDLAFGKQRVNDSGDVLDADIHVMVRLDELTQPPLVAKTVAASRAGMRRGTAIVSRPRDPRTTVRDLVVAGRPARHYRPRGDTGQLPLLVFYHGGGWALGDLDTHDGFCSRVAAEAEFVVISVDYRLAPEHPCPAPFDDSLAAYLDARARAGELGGDPDRVAVGGDSAGGNLASAVSMACRDGGHPLPWLQLLIYPAVDLRRLTASHRTCADGPLLTAHDVQAFLDFFAAPDLTDVRVSPGCAADLSGLPRAIVHTAGFDVLRDEGQDYAKRMAAAGVDVTALHAAALPHGFISMDGLIPAADAENARLIEALRAASRKSDRSPAA